MRRNKNSYMLLIIVLMIGITIGYAALNSTLNINGKSNVSKNTWNVHFDNIKVKDKSIEAVKTPVIENNTNINFEVSLNLPGDFYEFTVDIVNNGTIDAMIESINKTPDLTPAQKNYFDYLIEYQNGEQITTKQLLKSSEYVRIKVKVEYKSDITASDLPQTTETLNLGFTVNYVQSDGTGNRVKDNGVFLIKADGLIDEIGTIVTIGTEQFYTIGTEGDNVKLLSMYNLYVGNECVSKSSCTPYGEEATGIQDSTMIGEPSDRSYPIRGTTAFSSDEQKGINYSDYSGSIVEEYVNNYNDYLIMQGVTPIEARLITDDELFSLGCNRSGCTNAPSWVYATTYWTGSVIDDDELWFVAGGDFVDNDYDDYKGGGVRPVIIIPKSEIKIEVKPVANGDINEIGTIVTIGSEQFYTIGTEGNNVKLLSKYNLYVGEECTYDFETDTSICTAYENATGMQDENMTGIYYWDAPSTGVVKFSDVSVNYSGSVVEEHVNNYKNLLKENFGLNVKEARILNYDELSNAETFNCFGFELCSDRYPWIYSTSYWTDYAYSDTGVWCIMSNGNSVQNGYNYEGSDFGVRPVIIVSKDIFE